MRSFLVTSAAVSVFVGAAFAQDAAPELRDLSETAPQELDALSGGTELDTLTAEAPPVVREPISVTLRALDKVIARYVDIVAPINEPVKFGTLEIVARPCHKRPPEEFPETTAFLEIGDYGLEGAARTPAEAAAEEDAPELIAEAVDLDAPSDEGAADGYPEGFDPAAVPPGPGGERVFTGWMFASNPALNPLAHPVYDVWVIDCASRVVEPEPQPETDGEASDSTASASR